MKTKLRIVHLEDTPSDAELVERELRKSAILFDKIVVDNRNDYINALDNFFPDIVLSDHSLPAFNSIEALKILKEKELGIPFILITSTMTDEFAVSIMKEGANDYIIKDRLQRLPTAIINTIELSKLERERHKFVELITLNEKRFRALIENSPDMISISTEEGKIIYSSPNILKVLGYSNAEFESLTGKDLMHPDDLNSFMQRRKTITHEPGKSFKHTQRVKHKLGHWVWIESTVTNLLNESGIKAYVSNFRDITEKKNAEQQREFDKSNLDALINNTEDLMWSFDQSLKLISFNQTFKSIIKRYLNTDLYEGLHILDLATNEHQFKRFQSYYQRALAGEEFIEIEHNTEPVESWLEISFSPIRKGQNIIGAACHSRDITKRKLIENQLNNSLAFSKGVLNSLSSHLAVIDKNGNIITVNDAWTRFGIENGVGIIQKTGVGGNYFTVYEEAIKSGVEDALIVLNGLKAVMSGEQESFYHEYPCHAISEKRWFGLRVFKFESDELLLVLSHQDITDRKTGEFERAKIINDLIQRNKDLEQFAYIVSHNLRAPVANIMGIASALKDDLSAHYEKDKLNSALEISVNKLDEVVNDLGNILHVKREINEKREAIKFSELVVAIIESIRSLIEKENIEIIYNFDEINEYLTIKSYLYSVFYNLIINSIKYRQPKKRCTIEITSRRYEDQLELYFKDNGMGINLDKMGNQIFGLYKRFHLEIEGKGMGLFMVKTQLETLGASISVRSEVNVGTEFKIILPHS